MEILIAVLTIIVVAVLVAHVFDRFGRPYRTTFYFDHGVKVTANFSDLEFKTGGRVNWKVKGRGIRQMVGYTQADNLYAVKYKDRRRSICL